MEPETVIRELAGVLFALATLAVGVAVATVAVYSNVSWYYPSVGVMLFLSIAVLVYGAYENAQHAI